MRKLIIIKVMFYLILAGGIYLYNQSKNEVTIERYPYSNDYIVREGKLIKTIAPKEEAYRIYNKLKINSYGKRIFRKLNASI